jgi:hypothetical protein
MAAIYSNGGNRWNILGFNFTKRDALSSLYKISMLEAFLLLPLPALPQTVQLSTHLFDISAISSLLQWKQEYQQKAFS